MAIHPSRSKLADWSVNDLPTDSAALAAEVEVEVEVGAKEAADATAEKRNWEKNE